MMYGLVIVPVASWLLLFKNQFLGIDHWLGIIDVNIFLHKNFYQYYNYLLYDICRHVCAQKYFIVDKAPSE